VLDEETASNSLGLVVDLWGGDAMSVELDGHAAVRNYVAQVDAWLTAPDGTPSMTDDEIAGLFPPEPA
jgi:hypothetical protein